MSIETVKAISYITSVAASELTMLQWISMLGKVYVNGIPEEAKCGDVIKYYAEKFPNFEARCKETSQEAYDKLYEDFIEFVNKQ